MAWANSRAVPVAEAVLSLRSRGAQDHRGRHRGREGRELGVEPTDPGVAVGGALFGVAVDLTDRVVDIDQRQPTVTVVSFGAGDQARGPGW